MDLKHAQLSSGLIISTRRNIGFRGSIKENLQFSFRRQNYNTNINIPSKIFKVQLLIILIITKDIIYLDFI